MNIKSNKSKKGSLQKVLLGFLVAGLSSLLTWNTSLALEANQKTSQKLIYLNVERLELSKQKIEAKDSWYVNAYDSIIALANSELKAKIDPVTNKTVMPASGNMNDYHTLGSYYWPDTTQKDGLP